MGLAATVTIFVALPSVRVPVPAPDVPVVA